MEKYKIVSRNKENGTVTIKSSNGRYQIVNESAFYDGYVKLKDAAISLVRKGKELLTYIGGKIANIITPVHTAMNSGDGIYVKLSGDMQELAEDAGVEYNDSEFDTHLDEEINSEMSDKEGIELIKHMLARACMFATTSPDKMHEAAYAEPFAYDYPFGAENSRIHKDDHIEGRDISGSGAGVRMQPLRSWVYGINDFGYDDVLNKLDKRISKIFETEITGTSAMTCAEDKSTAYTPVLIMGAPGIGKTQIIKGLAKKYEEKLGKKVGFVHLMCNTMNKYSVSAPGIQFDLKIEHDEEGSPVFDENTKKLDTYYDQNVKKVVTTASANIPSFKPLSFKKGSDSSNAKLAMEYNMKADNDLGYGIIFIDELGRLKSTELLDAISQLAQQRSFGDAVLGTHWAVVCASNFPPYDMSKIPSALTNDSSDADIQKKYKEVIEGSINDKSMIGKILGPILNPNKYDPAFRRRFDVWNFVPTYERWREWAVEAGINHLIINFLDSPVFRFQWYNTFDKTSGAELVPTPRDWEKLSEMFDDIEKEYGGDYLKLTDANKISSFINDIQSALMEKSISLGKRGGDMEDYLEDNLKYLSELDCKKAWVDPKTITFSSKGTTLMKNIRVNASGRVFSTSPEELAQRVYANRPKDLVIKSKDDIVAFSNIGSKYLDNLADFVCNFYGEYLPISQGNPVYDYSNQYNEVSTIGGKQRIKQNKIHPNHAGQAYTFVECIINDFMRDIKAADPNDVYTPSMFFSSMSSLSGYERDPRSLKFAVLYNDTIKYGKSI